MRRHLNQIEWNFELEIMCKMCLSIISRKVYSMRHYEIRDSKLIRNEYFSTRTDQMMDIDVTRRANEAAVWWQEAHDLIKEHNLEGKQLPGQKIL